MSLFPKDMLTPEETVDEQGALNGVMAMVTGGRLGRIPNISTVPYGLVGMRTSSTVDLVAYATTGQNNAFIARMPNNVADPMDATQILLPAVDVSALPAVYTTSGPLWTAANIGSFPVSQVIPRDYKIEENFETGMKCADEACLTVTTLQAGSVALTGTITSAVIPSSVPRQSLTKTGLLANVGKTGDITMTAVNSTPYVIGAGDGQPYTFAGNYVDNPDSYQMAKVINLGASTATVVAAYCGGDGLGGIPDYITSPVTLTWDATLTPGVALQNNNTYLLQVGVTLDYANVSPTGVFTLTSTNLQSQELMSGPTALPITVKNGGSARVVNPTKNLGYTSYLIGVRCNIQLNNISTPGAVAFTGAVLNVSMSMPNQSPSFRAGDKVLLVQNYQGPLTVLHNQHWMARPNVNRQADYRGQLNIPFPTMYRDAVLDCIYTALGSSMGRVFADRPNYDQYVAMMDKPETIIRAIGHPIPGHTPAVVSDASMAQSESSARAPILQAARYRAEANIPHSQYSSSFWTTLASIGKTILRKALPVVAPEITNALTSLLDDDYKSSRYSSTSQIPVYGSESYHATNFGETTSIEMDTLGDDSKNNGYVIEDSFDPLESTDAPEEVRRFVWVTKDAEKKKPGSGNPDLISFLYESKYIELLSPIDRVDWIYRYMHHYNPTLSCALKTCKCCKLVCSHLRFSASSGPDQPKRVEFVQSQNILRVQPKVTNFNHTQVVASALHAAGYRPGAENSRALLTSLGVENTGKLRGSDFEPFDLPDVDEEDDAFELPKPKPKPKAKKEETKRQPVPVRKQPVEQELKQEVPVFEPPDEEADSLRSDADYPPLDKERLSTMMTPVANKFFYNVLSTGAGPLVSGKWASRLERVSKPSGNNFPANAANFMLVGRGGVYIATLAVTSLPLNRTFSKFPNKEEGAKLASYLRKTYAMNAVSKTRPGPGNKPEVLNYHVGLEFSQKTHRYIQTVVDLYHAIAKPPTNTHRFISVEMHGRPIDDEGIDGNSFSVALLCALLGLPCGPALTGALNPDGTIGMVGDIAAKLSPFYRNKNQKFGPLIFPAGQISFKDGVNFPLMCNMNSWSYIFEVNCYEVASFRDVLSFFTGGGYDNWVKRMDPTNNKTATMERIGDAVNAAMQVASIKAHLTKTDSEIDRVNEDDNLTPEEKEAALTDLTAKREVFVGQFTRARALLTDSFEHKNNVKGKTEKSEVAKHNGEANTNLQRYKSNKNSLYAKVRADGSLTKKVGKLTRYLANFPVEDLRGKDVPVAKQEMYWAYRNLVGNFYDDGKDWTFVIELVNHADTEQDVAFDDLF